MVGWVGCIRYGTGIYDREKIVILLWYFFFCFFVFMIILFSIVLCFWRSE